MDTRTRILDVSSRMFAQTGYDGVTMRHVAAALGMTPANIYHHFKDKEELIRESLKFIFTGKTAALEEIFKNNTDSSSRLELFASEFYTLLSQDVVFSKLFHRELLDADSTRLESLVRSTLQRPFNSLVDLVQECMPTDAPIMTAVSVIGIIIGHHYLSGIVQHLTQRPGESSDQVFIKKQIIQAIRSQLHLEHHLKQERI